jgi:hypothetical protein
MRATKLALVGLVALLLAGCGTSKYKDAIVGKWQNTKIPDSRMEFKGDGTVAFENNMGHFTATYSLDANDNLNMTTNQPINGNTKFRSKISISDDVLTMTDPNGHVSTFKRMK